MLTGEIFAEAIPNGPASLSALGILALVVAWFIRRMDRTDKQRDEDMRDKDKDIAALQARIEVLLLDNAEQHRMKHDALNKQTVVTAQLSMFQRAARRCTCGAMDGAVAFSDEL